MGLNAQTTVPAFTAGQVLTAEQQTNINTGIPVFADSTARDAAFGGTGEKTLAEGQYAFLEDTNATQFYDGSTWQVVGASGLTYLTGGAFSAVASVSLANDTFTATYRNYLVNINVTTASADSARLEWRGRTSGTDNTTSNYYGAIRGARYSDGLATAGGNNSGDTKSIFTRCQNPSVSNVVTAVFFNPQQATNTSYVVNSTGRGSGDPNAAFYGGGYFGASTVFDAITFRVDTGTITGTYEVYGYAIS